MQHVKMPKNVNLFGKKYAQSRGNSKKAKRFRKKLQVQKKQVRHERKANRLLNEMMAIEVFKQKKKNDKQISHAQLAYIKENVMKKVKDMLKNKGRSSDNQVPRSGSDVNGTAAEPSGKTQEAVHS